MSAARRTLWLFLVTLLLAVVAYASWSTSRPRPELVLAFLERNDPFLSAEQRQRSAQFEQIHRRTLEQLVHEYNGSQARYRLRLLPPTALPAVGSVADYQAYLSQRYTALTNVPGLIGVLDNCWGRDIEPMVEQLRDFPAPIVFLNGDRNGHDFGKGRIFVGNADGVPLEITALLPSILKPRGEIDSSDCLFVTEVDFPVGQKFGELFRSTKTVMGGRVDLPSIATKDRSVQARAKAEIITKLLRQDDWRKMQARPKLLVMNAHAEWGNLLLTWLDETFQNLTVIGHQSMLSRAPGFSFGNGRNELVLLSASDQTIPESIFLRHRRLSAAAPEIFARADSVYYVRRCVLAMDACLAALGELAGAEHDPATPAGRLQLRLALERLVRQGIRGSLGEYRFSAQREFLGQNHFMSYRERRLSSFGFQLSYGSEMSALPKVVPNTHVGVRNVRITDVDIAADSLHVELDYWLREVNPELLLEGTNSISASSTLVPVDFKPDNLVDSEVGRFGQRLLATKTVDRVRQRTFHLSGKLNASLESRLYPFDRHRLKVELQAWRPDDKMRLSRQQIDPGGVKVDGWTVGDTFLGLNTRESNPEPIFASLSGGQSSQHDTITLTVDVRRKLWNALLLLVVPLSLLAFASLAVLFIKFRAPDGKLDPVSLPAGGKKGKPQASPQAPDTEFEEYKTQTELSIGAVLAVITYLISYANLVPRVQTLLYSDLLVGLTLAISVFNFVFVVAVRARGGRLEWLDLETYRGFAVIVTLAGFLLWVVLGFILQSG